MVESKFETSFPVLSLNFFYNIMLLFILSSFFPFSALIILEDYCRKIKESKKKGKKKGRKEGKEGRRRRRKGKRERRKEGRKEIGKKRKYAL